MKLKTMSLVPAILAAGVLAAAPAAHAVDGVTLITQATAATGLPGCANDGASLITICNPGSYRLSGNLLASGRDGIDVIADGVTLDLNGFTISQSVAGTGLGISTVNRGVSVANGTVAGFATDVSLQGSGESLSGVRALDAGSLNISLLTGVITGSSALGGVNGIQIGDGMLENSTVQGGTGYGVEFTNGGLAKSNLLSNAGTCLVGGGPVRVEDNTFDSACHTALTLSEDGVYTGNIFNGVGAIGDGGSNGGQNVEVNIGVSGIVSVGWNLASNKGGI